jgi:hypothetical protein
MTSADLTVLASRLAVSALASFLAILLWSRTRDVAWMLVVTGTIASYADILYSLLVALGAIDAADFSPGGLPIGPIVFANLPYVLFSAAFILMIVRKRTR